MSAMSTLTTSKEAFQLYKNLAASKNKPGEWRRHAAELLERGNTLQAKAILETLLAEPQPDIDAELLLVQAYLNAQPCHTEEAVQLSRKAYKQASTSGGKHAVNSALTLAVTLGHVGRKVELSEHKKQRNRLEGMQVLEATLESVVDPKDQARLLYNLAVLSGEADQPAKAMDSVKAALQLCNKHGSDPELTSACLVLLALLLSARQQGKAALTSLAAASNMDGVGAGPSPLDGARPHDALLARAKASLLKAHAADTQGALAELVSVKQQVGEARKAAGLGAAQQQELEGLEAQLWLDMAAVLLPSDSRADALFCCDAALKLRPWAPDCHHTLGLVQQAAGRPDAAQDAFNTALSLDPRHAPSLISLGTLHRQRGDAHVACALLSEGLRYSPATTAGWHNLGLACRALGHHEEAERHLATAVSLAASTPPMPYSELPLLLPQLTLPAAL